MANQNDILNLTLYFDYKNNEAGFSQIMNSLDKISEQAEKTMRENSQLFNNNDMEKSIREYRNYIERVKEALETSWNPNTQSFNLSEAFDIDNEAFNRLSQGIGGVRTSFLETNNAIKLSGEEISKYKEKIDNFKLTIANAFRYNVVNEFMDFLTSQVSETIHYIEELDQALNNIRIVSGKSAEEMFKFAEYANEAAKGLGRTATEYAQAAEIYYQQGLKQEEVIARTNDTLILANITGDSVSEAADKLTSVMNGYQLATEDSTRALDVMAKLGADTATDFSEIASSMQKVSAQANSANLTLEQTTAMLATIMSITREAPETVGTSLKAIIARLNELKFTSGEETSRVQKQFQEIGMSIFDTNGQIKDTTVLLNEIADKFQTADKNTKAIIATAVAGAEQQNRFITLMDNWDIYNEYLDKAYNSSGAALEQNEIYMDSLQAKSKELKNTIDSIKFDLFMDKDVGSILEIFDGIATYARTYIDDFGSLNQILITGIALMTKMFAPEQIIKATNAVTNFANQYKTFKSQNQNGNLFSFISFNQKSQQDAINTAFSNLRAGITDTITQQNALNAVTETYGEAAGKSFAKTIDSIRTVSNSLIQLNSQMTTRIFGQDFTGLNYTDLKKGTETLQNLTTNLDKLGIKGKAAQLVIKNLRKETFSSADQFLSVDASLKTFTSTLNKLSSEVPLSGKMKEWLMNANKLSAEISTLTERTEQFQKILNRQNQITKWTSGFVAASVAIGGLFNAVDQFNNGDVLGGISGLSSSLGSAGLMLGSVSATLPVIGAGLLGLSAVISGVNNAIQESIQNTIEVGQKYSQTADSLSGYEEQANKLIKTLKDEKASTEDVKKAKEDLINLQNTLIEKYGMEAQGLADLNKNTQEYFATLSKIEADKFLNTANIDSIFNKMEEPKNWVPFWRSNETILGLNGFSEELLDVANSIEGITVSKGPNGYVFDMIKMDAQEASTTLNEFITKLREFSYTTDDTTADQAKQLMEIAQKSLVDAEETISKYGDTYDQIVQAQIKSNTDISNKIDQVTITSELYKQGLIEGNLEDIKHYKNEYEKALSELTNLNLEGLNLDPNMYDAINKAIKEYTKNVADSIEETKNLNDEIDNIQDVDNSKSIENFGDLTDSLDKLKGQFEAFQENGEITADMLTTLNENFGNVSGFEDFAAVLMDASSTQQDIQKAFDDFGRSMIYNSSLINQLTSENKAWIDSELEKKGIMNASAITTGILQAKTMSLTDAANQLGFENDNLISSEYFLQNALNVTEIATDDASLAMYQYYLSKVSTGEIDISSVTIGEANALIAMAEALGGAGEQMERWIRLKQIEAQVETIMEQPNKLENFSRFMSLSVEAARLKNELAGWTPDQISVKSGFFDIGSWKGAPSTEKEKKSGSSGGSKASEKEIEAYQAQIDKYAELKNKIEEIKNEIDNLEQDIDNEKDINKKNELIEKQIDLIEQQKNLQHELNNARDTEIQQNVELLRSKGFDVLYDPETNKLQIKNEEHLNELKAENQEATNELIKEYEKLINTTKDLNSENIDSSETWRDLAQKQKEAYEQIEENRRTLFQDTTDDKLFNTIFFENLTNGQIKVKEIYQDILKDYTKELERVYELGLDKTDDYVQDLIEKIYEMKENINDIDKELFDIRLGNYDRILSIIEDSSHGTQKQISIISQKIIDLDNRIAEKELENIELVGNELLELYEERSKALKDLYNAQKELLEDQQDSYDTVIGSVTNAIDEEIERLEQEIAEREKANEEREKELELMKLKAALEAAQNQKTLQIYKKDQGFVWEADPKAIEDAQDAIDDFYRENDEESQALQDKIDALEEYKKQWESIPDKIQQAEDDALTAEILGKDWQNSIFGMREDILNSFRDNYKNTVTDLKNAEEEYQSQIEQLAKDTELLQQRIENSAKAISYAFASLFGSNTKAWYATSSGEAPKDAQIGDVIQTGNGIYQIVEPNTEGAGYNPITDRWSIFLGSLQTSIDKLTGEQIIDKESLDLIADSLSGDIADFLEINNTNLQDANIKIDNNTKTLEKLDKNLTEYSDNIKKAVENTDASAKNAKTSEKNASYSAMDAAYSASEAEDYAEEAKEALKLINSSTATGSGAHTGINMSPIGSKSGTDFFDKNFKRIANGDLKNNEMLALLTKGEIVFTPEQFQNTLGALNYSLQTIDELSSLQNTIYSLGKIQGLNTINNLPFTNQKNNPQFIFGDINIEMHEVNNAEEFSEVLKNNIKNIFVQTLANR